MRAEQEMLQNRIYRHGIGVVAIICVIVGVASLLKSTSVSKDTAHLEIDNPWVDSLHDFIRVSGPVQTLTLEGTEISTDSGRSELRRYPLIRFHYDASGRVIKREDLREDGVPLTPTVYTYDHKGRLVKEAHQDILQITTSETLYKYDSTGRPAKQVHIDTDDGTIFTKRVFAYDEDKGITKLSTFDGERLKTRVEVLGNSQGQIVETRLTFYWPDGSVDPSLSRKSLISYDAFGNVKGKSLFDNSGKLVEEVAFSYELDSHNNWTKQVKDIKHFSEGGTPSLSREVFHRTITYK
ncbi:MAG: hypothetical protein H7Z38_07520 [Rubrivivax sp.]|nr:hypothetical protein [Pyrinomonadaceae bacterium]